MIENRLRVYYGPESDTAVAGLEPIPAKETITLPLEEIFPLLAEAVQGQRTWLEDFEGDQITVSTDLYEMILAYQHYRRPTA